MLRNIATAHRMLTLILLLTLCQLGGWVTARAPSHQASPCPEQVGFSIIPGNQRLFFTLPSNKTDDPSMELWYIDAKGTHQTPVKSLAKEDLLEISPKGDTILVLRTISEGEPVLFRHVFDFRGTFITSVAAISTSDFSIVELEIPAAVRSMRLSRRVYWIDKDVALLVSAPGERQLVTLDVRTGDVAIDQWQPLPAQAIEHPGSYFLPSPSGEYLFYSVDYPLIGFPYELAWRIVNRESQIVLDFVAGVAQTAVWLPDSSGVIVQRADYGETRDEDRFVLIRVSLDGSQVELVESAERLKWGVVDPTGTRVAYMTDERQPKPIPELHILEIDSGRLVDACASFITDTGLWSQNGVLLAYKTQDLETSQIYVLDTQNNLVVPILPYQTRDDVLALDYVRIVGWDD